MSESIEHKKLEKLVHNIEPQSRLIRSWRLTGGVSAQVTVLEIERPCNRLKKLVVRRHGERDLAQNPQVAADEFKLLQLLKSAGLAAPVPVYLGQSDDIFSTPYLVVEYIEGKTDFAPVELSSYIRQLTTQLVRIHGVDSSTQAFHFLPKPERRYAKSIDERPQDADESESTDTIRRVLEAVWPLPQLNDSVLLHGDFWPGNILWHNGQLVAIIDWEDAGFGEPLADVANSRLELLWAFGSEAMHSFTQIYRSKMPEIDFGNLPYWDLSVALRNAPLFASWVEDETSEKTMRDRHTLFITQALAALSIPRT